MAKNFKKRYRDLIDERLEDRLKDFKEALEKSKNNKTFEIDGNKYESFIDWLNSYALAYSDDIHYYRGKRLELSWEDSQDYFVFFEDGIIEYHYLDWFDGEERALMKRFLIGNDLEIMKEVRDMLELEF